MPEELLPGSVLLASWTAHSAVRKRLPELRNDRSQRADFPPSANRLSRAIPSPPPGLKGTAIAEGSSTGTMLAIARRSLPRPGHTVLTFSDHLPAFLSAILSKNKAPILRSASGISSHSLRGHEEERQNSQTPAEVWCLGRHRTAPGRREDGINRCAGKSDHTNPNGSDERHLREEIGGPGRLT